MLATTWTHGKDFSFQPSIGAVAVPGIIIGHRLISEGDERALLPEEIDTFANSAIKSQRASGAARIVARAQQVFSAKPAYALEWLRTALRSLGDRAPIQVLNSDAGGCES